MSTFRQSSAASAPEKQLMRFACSMSRSIDPRRPYKLEDPSSVNEVPRVRDLEQRVLKYKQARDLENPGNRYDRANEKYQKTRQRLRNEKQRPRNRLIRENLERYKNEQPVIDSERQLAGKMVDGEVIGALQQTGYMTLQHLTLIDTVLTMPGNTVDRGRDCILPYGGFAAALPLPEASSTRRYSIHPREEARPFRG